jgi:hypothetical protein
MANTINLDKGFVGRGQHGGWRNADRVRRLGVLAASALILLGLAAGGFFIRERMATEPVTPQAATNPFANDPHSYSEWDFREDPRVYAPVPPLDPEQQERTQVAPGAVPVAVPNTPGFTWDDYATMPSWAAPIAPVASPNPWSGTCRPGLADCQQDEPFSPGVRQEPDYTSLIP